jgi:hypothetical protein
MSVPDLTKVEDGLVAEWLYQLASNKNGSSGRLRGHGWPPSAPFRRPAALGFQERDYTK